MSGQSLINILHSSNTWEQMGIKWSSAPAIYNLQENYKCYKLDWDWSIMKGILIGEQSTFLAVSSSIQGLYLNLHICRLLHMHFIWNKFGCDRSKTYFLGYISPSIQGIFLKLYTLHSLCIPYKRFKFSCNRSIMKGTLLGDQRTSLALSHLPLEDFHETLYISLTGHAVQMV
jgi:hypothetical protein